MRGRTWRLLTIVALAFAGAACHKPVTATFGQPFPLQVGQAARFHGGDLELYFRRVAADSRCPRGVQCIVAGDATVSLEGRIMKGAPESFDMRLPVQAASPDSVSERVLDGYWIRFLNLKPSPVSGTPVDTTAYVGTFMVGKR
jgi:hypothetical protein